MSSLEYGGRYNPAEEESEENENKPSELHDDVAQIKSQCSHVWDDLEQGEMMDQFLNDAQEFYDTNPKGWKDLLKTTKDKLLKAEDETEVEDIIRAAITSGTDYMP